ncbi:hypothetical protein P7C70_g8021, partial [Phenoliferia sp. Uapishka_3]
MVADKGWDYFRDREAAVLEQLLTVQSRGEVIVLGGGVVERESNRDLLRQYARTKGPVIHISRHMEEVFAYLRRQATKSTWAAFEQEGRVSTLRFYFEPFGFTSFNGDLLVWNSRLAWYEGCSNLNFVTFSRSTTARHPSLALKHVEGAIQRLVQATINLPTPFQPFIASWTKPRSSVIVLTGEDSALTDAGELELVSRGADALELQVDSLPDRFAGSPLNSAAHSPVLSRPGSPLPLVGSNPNPYHASLAAGFLRHNSPLPLIWTVRTHVQGGKFIGSRSDYIRLVERGFRLSCDFVDVELELSDDEVLSVLLLRGAGTQAILSYTWTATSEIPAWGSSIVEEMYLRAVHLGADVVRLSMPAQSTSSNFDAAAFQSSLAEKNSVPLIAINTGFTGSPSRIFNPILTPITHPRLAAHAPGELTHREIQQGLRLNGLQANRIVVDFGSRALDSAFLRAGVNDLGLLYTFVKPTPEQTLDDFISRPDFGGALLSSDASSPSPSSTSLLPSTTTSTIGFAD